MLSFSSASISTIDAGTDASSRLALRTSVGIPIGDEIIASTEITASVEIAMSTENAVSKDISASTEIAVSTEIAAPPIALSNDKMCDNCENSRATVKCLACMEYYCAACDPLLHQSAKKKLHQRIGQGNTSSFTSVLIFSRNKV